MKHECICDNSGMGFCSLRDSGDSPCDMEDHYRAQLAEAESHIIELRGEIQVREGETQYEEERRKKAEAREARYKGALEEVLEGFRLSGFEHHFKETIAAIQDALKGGSNDG